MPKRKNWTETMATERQKKANEVAANLSALVGMDVTVYAPRTEKGGHFSISVPHTMVTLHDKGAEVHHRAPIEISMKDAFSAWITQGKCLLKSDKKKGKKS